MQERFQNKRVSPKIARLISSFEDPENIATSIVQEMEVDGLPVQEVGPMENRSSVARDGKSQNSFWEASTRVENFLHIAYGRFFKIDVFHNQTTFQC